MISCHYCQKTDLPEQTIVCPRCGTTLYKTPTNVATTLKLIQEARDKSVLKGKNTEYEGRIDSLKETILGLRAKIFGYWFLFLAIIIFYTVYKNHKIAALEQTIITQQHTAAVMTKRQNLQGQTIAAYKKIYSFQHIGIYYGKLIAPQLPLTNEVVYVVEAGDDLEIVSTFFFGNNRFAHHIGRDNGLKDHDNIQPKQQLRIRAHYDSEVHR